MNIVVYLQLPGVTSLSMTKEQSERLARLIPGSRVTYCHDESEFVHALPQAEVACTWTFRQEWFALAPGLRIVSTPAAGQDYFSVEWPSGVLHWNGGFHGIIMAESAVAMILGMCRGLLSANTTHRDSPWPRSAIDAVARPLRGSTVAICGFGHIGRMIGKRLKAFGCRLIGVSQHPGHLPPIYFSSEDLLVTAADLDSYLPQIDHVVLVLPRSASTDHFLNRGRLSLLPSHATISNLGRGNALDETALMDALRAGRLAGACLDVTAVEPLPADSPLRSCPNLWITPHSSAFSPDYMDLYSNELSARIREGVLK